VCTTPARRAKIFDHAGTPCKMFDKILGSWRIKETLQSGLQVHVYIDFQVCGLCQGELERCYLHFTWLNLNAGLVDNPNEHIYYT
jgi:hypothetical protein